MVGVMVGVQGTLEVSRGSRSCMQILCDCTENRFKEVQCQWTHTAMPTAAYQAPQRARAPRPMPRSKSHAHSSSIQPAREK